MMFLTSALYVVAVALLARGRVIPDAEVNTPAGAVEPWFYLSRFLVFVVLALAVRAVLTLTRQVEAFSSDRGTSGLLNWAILAALIICVIRAFTSQATGAQELDIQNVGAQDLAILIPIGCSLFMAWREK